MEKKLNPNLLKLVKLLSDGAFHDGNYLGEQLSMTRGGIWKLIAQLQGYDIEIESLKGKGYRLLQPVKLLDEMQIRKALRDHQYREHYDFHLFASLTSTSDWLKKHCRQLQFFPYAEPVICLSEHLTQARGRLNRNWYSPFGANLLCSIAYRVATDFSRLSGLSLVMGLAVHAALSAFGVKGELMLKWPNDLYWRGAKCAGILVEFLAESHMYCDVIIGIGLNINMPKSAGTVIQNHYACLQDMVGNYVDRNEIAALVFIYVDRYLMRFLDTEEGLEHFQSEWSKLDFLRNKEITILNGNEEITGQVHGIDNRGNLLLEIDGRYRAIASGEATIVKSSLKIS